METPDQSAGTGDESSRLGAFLSGKDLTEIIEEREAVTSRDEEGEQHTFEADDDDWAIDLSLGEEVYLSSDEEVRFLDPNQSVAIDPGEFALLMTEETVKIPGTKAALISLKFEYALKGLINISGFHVDPNFHGKLVFSVYNAGPSPTLLRRGEEAFMLVFANLTSEVDQNRKDANFKDISRLKPRWLSGLQGRTASLEELDNQVAKLQQRVTILTTIVVALIGVLVTVVLSVGGG